MEATPVKPTLTDERKAEILEHLKEHPLAANREFLSRVLIDGDGQFLTNAMIDEILGKQKKPREPESASHYKRAIRVRRNPEIWRYLENYPGYQISSHGRIRHDERAKPDDVLKPRFSWYRGKLVVWYELRDRDGNRKSGFLGPLTLAAGFVKPWKKKSEPQEEEENDWDGPPEEETLNRD